MVENEIKMNSRTISCEFKDEKWQFIAPVMVTIGIKIFVSYFASMILSTIDINLVWFNGIILFIIQIIMDIGATKIITNVICELLEKEGEAPAIDIHLSKKFLFLISTIIAIVSAILV